MAQLKGKKILVTGRAGFIGFHLTKKLLELGAEVTIYDNLSNGKIENVKDNPKAKFIKGDILDLKQLCALEKFGLIYHFAAQVVVPYSMENPTEDFDNNARGTLNVLEKARKDKTRLVFASSAAVYGNPTQLPTPESSASTRSPARLVQSCWRRILPNVCATVRFSRNRREVCERLRFTLPRSHP